MPGDNSEEFWGTNSSMATDLLTGNTVSKLVRQVSVTTPIVWVYDMCAISLTMYIRSYQGTS